MALPAHPPAHALRSETLLPFPDADFFFFKEIILDDNFSALIVFFLKCC